MGVITDLIGSILCLNFNSKAPAAPTSLDKLPEKQGMSLNARDKAERDRLIYSVSID